MTTITIPTETLTKTLKFTTSFTLSPSEIVSAAITLTTTKTKIITEIPSGDITQATNVEQIFGLLFGFTIFTILLICVCNCTKRSAVEKAIARENKVYHLSDQ